MEKRKPDFRHFGEWVGTGGLSREVTQEPKCYYGWIPEILCGDRRNVQKDSHHCNTPPIWALWQWPDGSLS